MYEFGTATVLAGFLAILIFALRMRVPRGRGSSSSAPWCST